MSYYIPDPKTPIFVYKVSNNTLYLRCTVHIPLPADEDLVKNTPVYDPAQVKITRIYDHAPKPSVRPAWTLIDIFDIIIIPVVGILYDPRDPEGFKTRLRQTMADTYTFTATVNPLPGVPNSGGSAENTASKNGTIVIE